MPAVHPFALERPRSIAETVAILAEHHDDARIMAGGQSLTPLLTLGFSAPAVVVSLDRCDDLDHLERRGDRLHIGARVTASRLESDLLVRRELSLLALAASRVGSPHVRNFGTAVGNVCHADPGSDLVPALRCHDALVHLRSAGGQRSVALEELITGPFTTSIEPEEMAVALEVPDGGGDGWRVGYRKLVKRSGDLAMATCAVRLRTDGERVVTARIAIGGAVSRAVRLVTAEEAVAGATLTEATEIVRRVDLGDDTEGLLMPDITAPRSYLELMLPRFVAATIGDAASEEGR